MNKSNKPTYTSGPWEVGDDSVTGRYVYDPKGERIVAEAYPDEHQDYEANARLIAAAPEMLEALERTVFYYETLRKKFSLAEGYPDPSGIIENLDHMIPHLKAVIAKARGES